MSNPVVPRRDLAHLDTRTRLRTLAAVAVATALSHASPARLRTILSALSRYSRPASYEQVAAAREAVTTVSLRCASDEGCLPRSLAVVLLCRSRGVWPTWCVGVRARPPFGAHAWVEVDGHPVGESVDAAYFRPLLRVPRRG
jgi:hypothetical protein